MSRRERKRRRERSKGGAHRAVFLTLGVLFTTATIGILAVVGWVIGIAASAPSLSSLRPKVQGALSVVYASDGHTRLGFIQSSVLRQPVAESQIPLAMRQATVAIEDRRFYQHGGVDFEGIIRAGIRNFTSHHTVQGGSTLTMQLIRNLYTHDDAKTYARKIREAKLADDLENEHPGRAGKEWILTKYLNNVPYGTVGGQTAYGVQAASRVFFDKPASQLTLPEAALLAGLPQAPSEYNPFLDSHAARVRRNAVLRQMLRSGYITASQASQAESAPLGTKKNRYFAKRRESYFFDYVKQELVRKFGGAVVRRGGLKVYTTVDLKWQQIARAAIAKELPYPGSPSSALVAIDPSTGYIRAMASSQDYLRSKFNLAAQGHRQPGSTFKVMTLMTALRRGVDPKATYYTSKRLNFIDPVTKAKIDVQTDDHHYYGRENLFEALVHSDNTVYMQLGLDMGPSNVEQTAHDMGITSKLDPYPSISLGGLTYGVSPLEMARAYATVDNGGTRIRPIAITKVVFPDGHVDTSIGQTTRKKEFTDGQTYEAIKAMEANVQRGTGTRAQFQCTAAGKTGTTSNFTDAWFDGFTPKLVTAVWVGFPNSTASMTNVPWAGGGGEMFGGNAPAAIWHDFMSAVNGPHCTDFPQPTQPFQPIPFFGRYATTGTPPNLPGTPSDGTTGGYNGYTTPATPTTPAPKKKGNGGSKYPPQLYSSPPQPAPKTQTSPSDGGTPPGQGGTPPGQQVPNVVGGITTTPSG
ncbi:MAG TPA: transglycosylase domain-containing protein [Solirubrobacteraceae bacterium]|nr:transglycosylase domain-containing protein [Solirubrobacteraceae bacterium]